MSGKSDTWLCRALPSMLLCTLDGRCDCTAALPASHFPGGGSGLPKSPRKDTVGCSTNSRGICCTCCEWDSTFPAHHDAVVLVVAATACVHHLAMSSSKTTWRCEKNTTCERPPMTRTYLSDWIFMKGSISIRIQSLNVR
eukprot:5692280-Amphidinium_carterae.1